MAKEAVCKTATKEEILLFEGSNPSTDSINIYMIETKRTIEIQCRQCVNTFLTTPHIANKRNPKFCSAKCQHRSKRTGRIIHCYQCNLPVYCNNTRINNSQHIFCSQSCSAKFNNKKRKKIRPCKFCNSTKCYNPFCKKLNIPYLKSLYLLGLNKQDVGSSIFLQEIEKIKYTLTQLYIHESKTLKEIAHCYSFDYPNRLKRIFLLFEIPLRSREDRGRLSYQSGNHTINTSQNIQYHRGWHTTWDQKKVFLRSSYEFEVARYFDELEIKYLVEPFTVSYNNVNGAKSTYFPDFYIPSKNLILEVKSLFTVDKNTELKLKACKDLGYNTKLLFLDKKDDLNKFYKYFSENV